MNTKLVSLSFLFISLITAQAVGQSVLIFDDSSSSNDAETAVESLGYNSTSASDSSSFIREYGNGDNWDILVLDIGGSFTNDMQEVVVEHLELFKPVILAHGNMHSAGVNETLFGLTCSEVLSHHDFYATENSVLFEGMNSPLVGRNLTGRDGSSCVPNDESESEIFARLGSEDDASPAIYTTMEGRLLYNSIVLNNFRENDDDDDGTIDVVELITNELLFIQQANLAPLLVLSDGSASAASDFAEAEEINLLVAENAAYVLDQINNDRPMAGFYVEFADLSSIDPQVLEAIDLARTNDIPTAIFTADLDGSTAWQEHFNITLNADNDNAEMLTHGGGIGRWLFSLEEEFPFLEVTNDQIGDSLDEIILPNNTELEALAHFQTNDGPIAIVGSRSNGPFILGGFLLSELGENDANNDENIDRVQLLKNVFAYSELSTQIPALIFTDDPLPEETEAWILAEEENLLPIVETEAIGFRSALTYGNYGFTFILAQGINTEPFEDPLVHATIDEAVANNNGILVASHALELMPQFAAALDIEVVETYSQASNIIEDPANLQLLFKSPHLVDQLLATGEVAATENNGIRAINGSIAARYASNNDYLTNGAIAITHNSLVVVNAFDTHLVGQNGDMTEILLNELRVTREPLRALVFDAGPADTSIFAASATRVGLVPDIVTSVFSGEDVFDVDESLYTHLLIDSSLFNVFDSEGVQDAVFAWAETGKPLIIAFNDFDENPALATAFGIEVTADHNSDHELTPDRNQVQFFNEPFEVDYPLDEDPTYSGDLGDEILPLVNQGDLIAHYRRSSGPGAVSFSTNWLMLINAFAPRSFAAVDTNGDGIDEMVAFFANQLSILTRMPKLDISFPETSNEGQNIILDASDSTDPSSEELTFLWDLSDNGRFNDEEGDQIVIPGAGLDGPTTQTVALMVTNESGLSRTSSSTITIENVAPDANAGEDILILQGELAQLRATADDIAGDFLTYHWDFGDNSSEDGPDHDHEYTTLGTYQLTLTVSDEDGGQDTDDLEVTLQNHIPTIALEDPTAAINEGSIQTFVAQVTDLYDDEYSVAWDFGDGSTDDNITITDDDGYIQDHLFRDEGQFSITFSVLDEFGGQAAETTSLEVENVEPIFTSQWFGAPNQAHAQEQVVFEYDLEVLDPGLDDILTFELLNGPASMTLSDDGELRWLAGEFGFETVDVELQVSDGDGGSDNQQFQIVVDFVDDDGGGAPDSCENEFGFDTEDPIDDTADPDGDMLTTQEECIINTDPTVFSGPGAPVLVSPINGFGWEYESIEIVFENAVDPGDREVTYEAELYGDELLSDLILSVTDIEEGEETTSTFFADEFEEDKFYYWRVRGTSTLTAGRWSSVESFVYNIENSPPNPPELISPNGSTTENPPTLRIVNATDLEGEPLTYSFELYRGTVLSEESLIFFEENIPEGLTGETAVAMQDLIEGNIEYVWRARAFDGRDYGPFVVGIFSLTTQNDPPTDPEVIFPLSDQIVVGEPLILQWQNSEDPNERDVINYMVDVATDEQFTDIFASLSNVHQARGSVSTSTLLSISLQPENTYYWRVAATDGFSTSNYSFGDFVTIESNRPPSAPTIVSPSTGDFFTLTPEESFTFTVGNASDPDGHSLAYEFQVSLDRSMQPLIFGASEIEEGISQTEVTMESAFENSFFWRARVNDGIMNGPWSDIHSFVIEIDRPAEDVGADTGLTNADVSPSEQALAPTFTGGTGCTTAANKQNTLPLWIGILFWWTRRRKQ